jgi:crotonobetainyl-CoA:carnitine CoA-transferase CaiB-like acyl-CoA transferase
VVIKPLNGLKIIEYGEVISAPYCTRLLAGLGAEVIKIENVGTGDKARTNGPFPQDIPHPEKSGLFLSLNANKTGITLNLETEKGKEIFKRLIETADVLVENNDPGHMEKLALGYESLKAINPWLVMVSITPFGQTGPYRDYKAYHINSCGAGGMPIGIGDPKREPLTMPLSQGGYQAGGNAAGAIMAALLARRKTGKGQFIDISEVEVWATTHAGQNVLTYVYKGVNGIRRGIHGGRTYPNEVFPCKDGYVIVITPQLEQWKRFIEVLGSPEWSTNPRFRDRKTIAAQNPDEVNALIIPWMLEHTKEEICKLCQDKRVPCVPVYNIREVMNHPQVKALDFMVELDHPEAGMLKYPLGPCHFEKTNWEWNQTAPLLGADNKKIYGDRLGYSAKEMAALKKEGVI